MARNEANRQRNLAETVKHYGEEGLPPALRLAVARTEGKKVVGAANLKSKRLVKDMQYEVAKSTASVGKFNAPIPGDEKIKTRRGKRRAFDSNTDIKGTKKKELEFVNKLMMRERNARGAENGIDLDLAGTKLVQQNEEKQKKKKKRKKETRGKVTRGRILLSSE